MTTESPLIVGAGKFGRRFYDFLVAQGQQPITLSKSDKAWSNNHLKRNLLAKDLQLLNLSKVTQVYLIVTPSQRDQASYQQIYVTGLGNFLRQLLEQHQHFHATFLSSTAVYGSHTLGVIDENTPTEPDNFRGEVLLAAEKQVQQLAPSSTIVRASGLYSSQRQRLIASLTDKHKAADPKWLNLIHEADLCQCLVKASQNQWPMLLASDGVPFQRSQLSAKTELDMHAYRQFKSQYSAQLDFQYPSFIDWLKTL